MSEQEKTDQSRSDQPQLRAGEADLRGDDLTSSIQELVDSTRIFLKQWALVKPILDGQAVLAAVHGARYSGPTIGNEIERLERALMALPANVRQTEVGHVHSTAVAKHEAHR